MWLIVLEACAALAVLLFVVWWTMFSGRRGGEPPPEDDAPVGLPPPADGQAGQDAGGVEGEGAERGGNRKLNG